MGGGANGRYDNIMTVGSYKDGDTVGFYFDQGALVFLKNDEIIYQAPSPCGADACTMAPFVASYGQRPGAPAIYAY